MKIILNRKITRRGKAYVEATLDGKRIRWGARLSQAITGLRTWNMEEGICFFSEKPLAFEVRKGPLSKKFIIPPLNFEQSTNEFEAAFQGRIAIFKEVKKWIETPFCNDSVTIEI
ncbi:MAG: hypothetical protein DYG83_04365 [Candidatus Brocadia sp. AMX2]|uniref:Uncharacterized protein n=1 Tax=Candidatus Brocadia sinica JPN1 TaxID=1197129 RepID=A0ABQ0JZY1_9BACT|nr:MULTISPECIES: hypothetical protein [Brocadia]KXK32933.1 MAG: hypothetical protein UZ01_00355 [Candidatus Brocadia sinica]MBC6931713.1 hypothetical protein [Candidatus Brocadia sp.]MBL1169344.1 hypothetical protein [Candidatus Brocadia sp. AMX1]NOG42199.1 hypothetical protein [Planctomycetota bacterium]KAA0242259.1 MAG: hypothetical protein EDM70_15065 [Candidatus Brocadia sp. AMX2]